MMPDLRRALAQLWSESDRETVKAWHTRLLDLGHLYRYVSISGERFGWFSDLVMENQFYFPGFRDLNDPFDGRWRPRLEGTEDQRRAFWQNVVQLRGRELDDRALTAIEKWVAMTPEEERWQSRKAWDVTTGGAGVACFTEVSDDLPMWGHYADSHRGLCLRFRAKALLSLAPRCTVPIPITYADDYPIFSIFANSGFENILSAFCTKAKVWSREREWRIVRSPVTHPKQVEGESIVQEPGQGLVPFDPVALNGVIIGCEMVPEDKERVKNLLARRTPSVQLFEAHMAEGQFKLEIRPA